MNRRDEMEQERRIAERDLEPQWSERQAHIVSEMCRFERPCDSVPASVADVERHLLGIIQTKELRVVDAMRLLSLIRFYPLSHYCLERNDPPQFCPACGWRAIVDRAVQELKLAVAPVSFEQTHDLSFLWREPLRNPVDVAREIRDGQYRNGARK